MKKLFGKKEKREHEKRLSWGIESSNLSHSATCVFGWVMGGDGGDKKKKTLGRKENFRGEKGLNRKKVNHHDKSRDDTTCEKGLK